MEIKKITLKIKFEIGEDASILEQLKSEGWKLQEQSYHDAEMGLKGTQLKSACLERFYKY